MKRPLWFFALAMGALTTSALADDRVLVIPFASLNVPTDKQWVSKGVEENLIADLGRAGGFDPIGFGGQVIVEDNATAARLARNVNAPLVVRGSAQIVGDNIRLTAQLIDSRSGDTLRTGLVTGTAADLLKLEDDLAYQISGAPAATPAGPALAYIPVAPAVPPVVVIAPPEPAYAPYYPDYGYGAAYVPLVVVSGNHGRDHDAHEGRGGHGGAAGGNGGGMGVQVTQTDFDPAGLPIPLGGLMPIPDSIGLPIPNDNVLPVPTNNVLPIPTNNVLPIPTNNVLPVPTNNVLPVPLHGAGPVVTHINPPVPTSGTGPAPAVSSGAPRNNAGPNRNSRAGN